MTRLLALVLTVFTGFTGLVYEVAWQKLLATLLGSHSEATAAILAIFLGGLSAGYALFGRVTQQVVERAAARGQPPRLLRLYGAVEAGIGVYALLFPWLFRGMQALSIAVPHGAGGAGFALDVALTALLIGPPTVLMGGTIPVLTQALARGVEDATRFHAFVYACNTAGAFAGALAAGFVLVPWLGLAGVLQTMGCLNLTAGALFVVLGLRSGESIASPKAAPEPAASPVDVPSAFAACALAALLSGFAMMAIQTVLNRVGGLSFGASQFTFAMVVAVFVLCIALGSTAVSLLRRIPASVIVISQWLLVALLVLVYLEIENAPYYAYVLRTHFRDVDAAFYPYYAAAFVGMLLVLALPIGLSGATLPLLFHHLRREVRDLGGVAGRLYSWNTVGSLLGALLGGYVLLLWLDLHHVYRVALVALAVAASVLSVKVLELSWLRVAAFALVPALVVIAALPAWRPERLHAGLFRSRTPQAKTYDGPEALYREMGEGRVFIFHDDDPVNSVAVEDFKQPRGMSRSIVNNGKSDGSIPGDYTTMGLVGLLPALMIERPERALVIGYGTGVSAGELAALPEMKRVDVAEISPGVIEAAPFFDYGNLAASKNPKVHLQRIDAYRALLRSEEKYDIIVSEPSNPWVTGVEMLFSREFLTAAKERLSPGGAFAQWFHVYETDQATVDLVLRTYNAVFDHVGVWFAMHADILLLGFDDPERALDLPAIAARAARPEYQASLARSGVTSLPQLLAHEVLPLNVLRAGALEGNVHTLLHPVLSHRAARSFFRGLGADLLPMVSPAATEVGTRNSLLGRYSELTDRELRDVDRLQVVQTACALAEKACLTFLAAWSNEEPGSQQPGGMRAAAARMLMGAPPDTEARLRRLLGRDPVGDSPITFEDAQFDTEVFFTLYSYALPFERSVLANSWSRCQDPDPERCARGRAAAEARIGGLDGPHETVSRSGSAP